LECPNKNMEGKSRVAQLLAKISEMKQKASGAIEDVPDNLIGTILALAVLTLLGLGILMLLGYKMTVIK
jgi:hypothetical protein